MAEEQKPSQAQSTQVQRAEPSRAMSPWDEMERMMEDFFPRGWMRQFRGGLPRMGDMAPFEGRWPRVDVQDRESEVLVRAELPGVKKDGLDVSVSENAVTIKAETRSEREEGEKFGDFVIRAGYVAATQQGKDFHHNIRPEAFAS